jgi:uncharacterized membrane protein
LVPEAKNLTQREALPNILTEERHWTQQREKEQREALLSLVAAAAIGLLGLILPWWIYHRFGQKFKPLVEVEYYRELPGTYSPAEAGCLIEKGLVKPQVIAATFMDLARRGYLRLESAHNSATEDILVHQLKPAGEDLRTHERLLLNFFFDQVGEKQPAVWFSTLKLYRNGNPEATRDFINAFQAEIKYAVNAMQYLDTSNKGKTLAWLGAIVTLVCVFISYAASLFYPMIAFSLSFVAFILAAQKSRDFTKEGQAQYDLWQAFRHFLMDFSNLDQAQLPQLILWEHYLVYAVVLGVAKEVIKQLPIVYPQISDPSSNFGFYWGGLYHSSYGSNGALQESTFAGLANFDTMMASIGDTWNSAYSALETGGNSGSFLGGNSNTGDGGGFSGGGGDGGGGGGGDAN